MEQLTFRMAVREDTGLILSFIRRLADYEHMLDQVVADEETFAREAFDKKHAEILLAVADGTAVGMALFFHNFSTFLGRSGIYLEDLFVLPEYRGQGIGTAIFHRLAAIAVNRGCGRLEWCCLDWNEPSIRFYRSLGAVSMDDWTTYRLTGGQLNELAKEL